MHSSLLAAGKSRLLRPPEPDRPVLLLPPPGQIGSYVTVMGYVWLNAEGKDKCRIDPSNSKLGLAM